MGGGSLAVGHRQRAAKVGFADLDRSAPLRASTSGSSARDDDSLLRGDYCAARLGSGIADIARDRAIGKTESRGARMNLEDGV